MEVVPLAIEEKAKLHYRPTRGTGASVESVNLVETSPVMKETQEDQAFARKY
jgi:hypothetical protein